VVSGPGFKTPKRRFPARAVKGKSRPCPPALKKAKRLCAVKREAAGAAAAGGGRPETPKMPAGKPNVAQIAPGVSRPAFPTVGHSGKPNVAQFAQDKKADRALAEGMLAGDLGPALRYMW
jgi:hypothetical protein